MNKETSTATDPQKNPGPVTREEEIRQVCAKLVDLYRQLYEIKEEVKLYRDTLKERADGFLVWGEEDREKLKILVKLCELRGKSQAKREGDLVQQRLFDLDHEKTLISELQKYVPQHKRLGVQ